jgi:hypothetical protein
MIGSLKDRAARRARDLVAALTSRLERERQTIRAMAALRCRRLHGGEGLCAECAELVSYAEARLRHCPYGEAKPTCLRCPIHCYRPTSREQVRTLMRYAGPRMLTRHPLLTVLHVVDGVRDRLARSTRSQEHEHDTSFE